MNMYFLGIPYPSMPYSRTLTLHGLLSGSFATSCAASSRWGTDSLSFHHPLEKNTITRLLCDVTAACFSSSIFLSVTFIITLNSDHRELPEVSEPARLPRASTVCIGSSSCPGTHPRQLLSFHLVEAYFLKIPFHEITLARCNTIRNVSGIFWATT